ncbi:MAG: DUF1275 domain-containing protein [Bacteroidetes bacterium]|nr:DUF1275 domain-containing protein [Bacteroidota bacterium]
MFTHSGKSRSFRHNVRLAVFLPFAAGLVNVTGVFGLALLTTNVTGHFAYFAEGLFTRHSPEAMYYLLLILAFLAGSFASSLLTEYAMHRGHPAPFVVPVVIEVVLLLVAGFSADALLAGGIPKPLLGCFLLFIMGLQNALVSKVSSFAVRTTHLTGLFTDLGIGLAQLLFYKEDVVRRPLVDGIRLKGGIVLFFFCGCVAGGVLFGYLRYKVLIVAAGTLVVALLYGRLLLFYYRLVRNLFSKKR